MVKVMVKAKDIASLDENADGSQGFGQDQGQDQDDRRARVKVIVQTLAQVKADTISTGTVKVEFLCIVYQNDQGQYQGHRDGHGKCQLQGHGQGHGPSQSCCQCEGLSHGYNTFIVKVEVTVKILA